jgi:8-oxo-dGTP pyrophosphatase MutT (NUDIX family)
MAFAKLNFSIIEKMSNYCRSNPNFPIIETVSKSLHQDGKFTAGKKRASVLITLVNRNSIPSILFQLRTQNVGTHKGQVSFPGGHIEMGESSIDTAIREMSEEMGIDKTLLQNDLFLIGTGQTIPSVTGTLVTPHIAFLRSDVKDLSSFKRNSAEVDRIFTRSLEDLTDFTRNSVQQLSRNNVSFEAPIFGVNDEEERIWGLTAVILHATLKRVILPAYNHE